MTDSSQKRALVVDDDRGAANQVREILEGEGYQVILVGSGEEALIQISRETPDLIISDIVMPGIDGYALCQKLRQLPTTKHVPILLLTAKAEVADRLKGFEVGANDYLTRPFDATELRYRVRNLMARAEMPAVSQVAHPRAYVVAFFGTKGGVGKTLLATNTALAIQLRVHQRVAVFDVDLYFGNAGIQFNLPPVHSITDLQNAFDELTPELMQIVMTRHSSGLHVLLSPSQPEKAESITGKHIRQVLDFLRDAYDYVIVDCPPNYDERTLVVLEGADDIMLVMTPEVGPLSNTRAFFELAEKMNLPEKMMHIILNRADSNVGINPADIEQSIRHKVAFCVGSGGRPVVVSVNRGTPMVLAQPNHPFSRQIYLIADFIIRRAKTVIQ